MSSFSGTSKRNRCTSCGAHWKEVLLFPPEVPDKADLLCSDCIRRLEEGETITQIFLPGNEPTPGELGKRFDELFKVARVLLREGVEDEDQIIPTLVAAAIRKPGG